MRKALGINEVSGRRGWTRTSDPLLRRQMLYPPELRARERQALIPNVPITRTHGATGDHLLEVGVDRAPSQT